jgi:hypothetical protein
MNWSSSSLHGQSVCPPGSCVPPCMQFEIENCLPCTLHYVFGFVSGSTCGVNPGGAIAPNCTTVLVTAPCMHDQCDGGNCICATAWYIADQSVPALIDWWGAIQTIGCSGGCLPVEYSQIPYGDCPGCTSGKIKVVWSNSSTPGLLKATVRCD